jgi:hypothetical protein
MLLCVSGHAWESGTGRILDAELAHCESRLVDTGRFRTRAQDVGLDGDVVGIGYSLDLVEEAALSAWQKAARGTNVLWRRVHEVELARVLQDLGYAGVAPHGGDSLADPHVERLLGVGVNGVVDEIVAELVIAGRLGLDLELAHCANEGLCAVDDVLVDGEAVHGELLLRIAVLVDDLHLLDDGRLAALAGACRALACTRSRPGGGLPSSRILHSRRNRRESSSSLRSMAWLRFFCSTSSLLVLMQMPMVAGESATGGRGQRVRAATGPAASTRLSASQGSLSQVSARGETVLQPGRARDGPATV